MTNHGERRIPAPREDWSAVAAALNARMKARRIGQQQLADEAGVSVATLRVLQRGAGGRRVQDATLAAVCRALGWPSDHLLSILTGVALPGAAEPSRPVSDSQTEILAALLRIEAHVEAIARAHAPA